jgi:predicted SnoaL-like aldol condensation-catalyzing enzyme
MLPHIINARDPKLTALLFNESINNQDIHGLSRLMTDDHTIIVREGVTVRGKQPNIEGWAEFFAQFPNYRNTFTRVESKDELVIIVGFAYWSESQPYDPVIWTARIEGDRVAEWRIYDDTELNRKELGLRGPEIPDISGKSRRKI